VIAILVAGAFMLGRSQGTPPGTSLEPTDTVRTMPASTGGDRNDYPPGIWMNERLYRGEGGETEYIGLKPRQVPAVQPATHRKGF
jgi:hypothetical protein